MLVDTTTKTITATYTELRSAGYSLNTCAITVYPNGDVYYYTPPRTTDLRAKGLWSSKATDTRQKAPFVGLAAGRYEVNALYC